MLLVLYVNFLHGVGLIILVKKLSVVYGSSDDRIWVQHMRVWVPSCV